MEDCEWRPSSTGSGFVYQGLTKEREAGGDYKAAPLTAALWSLSVAITLSGLWGWAGTGLAKGLPRLSFTISLFIVGDVLPCSRGRLCEVWVFGKLSLYPLSD